MIETRKWRLSDGIEEPYAVFAMVEASLEQAPDQRGNYMDWSTGQFRSTVVIDGKRFVIRMDPEDKAPPGDSILARTRKET